LVYTHDKNIVHCDLKPENILVKSETSLSIKLIDFGTSCTAGNSIFSYVQSRYYRAPEIILGCEYGLMVDIWSLGCVIAELVTHRPLFYGRDEND